MNIDILKIEDTEDGGAIVTVEVDRDMLHFAFEQFLNQAIMDKVNETLREEAARKIFEEDELSSESDTAEEEDDEEREFKRVFRELDESEKGNTNWSDSFTYPHER